MDDPLANQAAAGEPAPSSQGDAAPCEHSKPHSGNGYVARLPKRVRDRLNLQLHDGVPAKKILESLGEHGRGLTEKHVSSWKTHGGYDDWRKQQGYLIQWRAKWEFAQDLVEQGHGLDIHQSTNQLIATQIHQIMHDLGSNALKDAITGGDRNVIQLVQAFAQLTKSEVDCERLRSDQSPEADGDGSRGPMTADTQKSIEKHDGLR